MATQLIAVHLARVPADDPRALHELVRSVVERIAPAEYVVDSSAAGLPLTARLRTTSRRGTCSNSNRRGLTLDTNQEHPQPQPFDSNLLCACMQPLKNARELLDHRGDVRKGCAGGERPSCGPSIGRRSSAAFSSMATTDE
jgi:hypothetical protein